MAQRRRPEVALDDEADPGVEVAPDGVSRAAGDEGLPLEGDQVGTVAGVVEAGPVGFEEQEPVGQQVDQGQAQRRLAGRRRPDQEQGPAGRRVAGGGGRRPTPRG